MIAMQLEGNRTGPRFFCDACGRKIENAKDGVYLWNPTAEKDGDTMPVYFACHYGATKRQCHRILEARHDATSWWHLDRFPVYLGNVIFDGSKGWKKARESVTASAEMFG